MLLRNQSKIPASSFEHNRNPDQLEKYVIDRLTLDMAEALRDRVGVIKSIDQPTGARLFEIKTHVYSSDEFRRMILQMRTMKARAQASNDTGMQDLLQGLYNILIHENEKANEQAILNELQNI